MNDQEVREYCQRLGYGSATFELIQAIRTNPPARTPKTGTRNRTGRIASQKMGATRGYESGTVERAYLLLHEDDPQTLEYWEQPAVPVSVSYEDATGRRVTYPTIADCFVLTQTGAWFEEYKPEARVIQTLQERPSFLLPAADGTWNCPSATASLAQYGLDYRVRTDKGIPRRRLRNVEFLRDYYAEDAAALDPAKAANLHSYVARHPGLTIAELLAADDITVVADDVYRSIVRGSLYVDLDEQAIAEAFRTRLFADSLAARSWQLRHDAPSKAGLDTRPLAIEPRSAVDWDGQSYTLVNSGGYSLTLRSPAGDLVSLTHGQVAALVASGDLRGATSSPLAAQGKASSLLAEATDEQLAVANHRFAAIERDDRGEPNPDVSRATLFRWQGLFRAAEAKYGWGFVGLIPAKHPGDRSRKLDPRVVELITETIKSVYLTVRGRSKRSAYDALVVRAQQAGLRPPSYQTWCREVNRHDRVVTTRAREGRKAAYQLEGPRLLSADTPVHGDRPFQIVHVDHTELDIELICARTLRNLGRPWLTLMMDAWSRRVVAFWLSFEPPSYRSTMAVLRACVRSHGRLPQTLVVDGGKEFRSIYFESFAALYGMSIEHRPAGGARHGSVLERMFGTTNTMFVHTLAGNTQATKRVRQLTKAILPANNATWDLEALYEALAGWFYEVYDGRDHPALGRTPGEAFAEGIRLGGTRPTTLIPYDETFLMASLPSTPKGTVRVDGTRGVKVNKIRYWCSALAGSRVHGRDVPVRIDPWDVRHVYVFVGERWVECVAQGLWHFDAVTERQILIATQEAKRTGRRIASERDLANTLEQPSEAVKLEALRSRAVIEVAARSDGRPAASPNLPEPTSVSPEVAGAAEAPAHGKPAQRAKRRATKSSASLFAIDQPAPLFEDGEQFGAYE